jgi:F0F1-type ATP synthase assembly protein I
MAQESPQRGNVSSNHTKKPDTVPLFVTYGKYGALGFEFAGAIIAGLFIGNYADTRFGTAPLLMVIGVIFGMAGAIYRLIIVLQRLSAREEDN